jgi:hypothetical protein
VGGEHTTSRRLSRTATIVNAQEHPTHGVNTAMQQRIVTLRDYGWEIAHEAVSRRPPISLYTIVARTQHAHVRHERLGFVPRARTLFCRPVPTSTSRFATVLHRCIDEGCGLAERCMAARADIVARGVAREQLTCVPLDISDAQSVEQFASTIRWRPQNNSSRASRWTSATRSRWSSSRRPSGGAPKTTAHVRLVGHQPRAVGAAVRVDHQVAPGGAAGQQTLRKT